LRILNLRLNKNDALRLVGVGGFLLIVVVVFAILTPNFATQRNAINVLSTVAVLGIVSIGQSYVLIAGGFDLSVSGTVPLGAIVFTLAVNAGWSVAGATFAALLVGAAVGVINAGLVSKVGIDALITTLGTLAIAKGVGFILSGGRTIPLKDFSFAPVTNKALGISIYVWILFGVSLAAFLILRYTSYGRMLFALGGNPEAAELAGLRVNVLTTSVYVICGALAAFAGSILAQQFLAGSPNVGQNAALDSITAVILGGASIKGGKGGIGGTLLGVLLLGAVANGLAIMHIPNFYQQIATGGLLIAAVSFGRLRETVERTILGVDVEE
jgi:ribose transport system permease protein